MEKYGMGRFFTGLISGICLFLAIFLSPNAWAVATLKGQVWLNREKGEPAQNVAVSADGANPALTRNDGTFVLFFPNRKPGQEVDLTVVRPGWVVVNDVQLSRPLPEEEGSPLHIVICKAAEWNTWALQFYRLKGSEIVQKEYERRLAELQVRQAATVEEREQLLRERDQAQSQANELARRLASQQATAATTKESSYREALRLFLDGKINAALEVLNEAQLEREATVAQKQLKDTAEGFLLRGQLLALRFDFAGASQAYSKATTYAPDSFDVWFQYGVFHQKQNHFVEAHRGYEHALKLAREAGAKESVALTLGNLGSLHRDENRHAEARKAYDEALETFRKLVQKNPDVYLPYVANTLINLGALHYGENRHTEARKAYDEALSIHRSLAQKNPDVYLPYVAMTLNNLGLLHSAENRHAEARKAFDEALSIRRSLAQKNPDVYLPNVAMTLNNLGVLHRAENRHTEARKAYDEALSIHRSLAQKNPDAYLPGVAETLDNLGNLHRDESRHAEALKAYEEALSIRRSLAQKNPDVYLPYVAQTLNNLGNLHRDENRHAEARKALEEARHIYRHFAAINPASYERDLRRVEDMLASLPK